MNRLRRAAQAATDRGLDSVLIREPATIAWLLGCRFHVPNTLDAACFDVLLTNLDADLPDVSVVSNAIEAPRLTATEFNSEISIAEHFVVPWWGARTDFLPVGPSVGSDRPWDEATDIGGDLARARRVLDADQHETLAHVSADAAAAVTRTALKLRPGLTEFAVAAILSAELLTAELEPVVLLVAADGRDREHRHPLPTSNVGQSSFLLVCCARRHGVIASVTRSVVFTSAGGDRAARRERHAAICRVEQAFLDASRPGDTLGTILQAGIEAYPANGFDAQEWTRHHQGGLSGFVSREALAQPGSDITLVENMVLAWNPSGDGCKIEDTCALTAAGVQPLVIDPQWPTLNVGGRARPDLLWL